MNLSKGLCSASNNCPIQHRPIWNIKTTGAHIAKKSQRHETHLGGLLVVDGATGEGRDEDLDHEAEGRALEGLVERQNGTGKRLLGVVRQVALGVHAAAGRQLGARNLVFFVCADSR